MKWGLMVALAVVWGGRVVHALPVKDKAPQEHHEDETKPEGEDAEDWELNLEYGRYLKEVVQALESDPAFRKKLETAEVDDIKSGKIARELHFVDHNVRTKLDELKRRELERLRHLAVQEHEKKTGVDRALLKVPVHIDHKNPTRFEVEDLKKLIIKTTADLEKVDQQRREEFKKYEMEKEFERQQDLKGLDDSHRQEAEKKHTDEVQKHHEHEKLHHPGSKQQLEQVWEEQDHLSKDDFDPKTFFHLHDLDGNGYWDELEVKSLFKKELDKMYDPNNPEDDINERYEEMERMREHVFRESDLDRDNLISFREFVEQTKKAEFEQDQGWQGLDEQELYSQQEYEEFERRRHEEIRQMVEAGVIPPPPGYPGMPPPQAAVYQGGPHPGMVGVPPPVAMPQYGVPPQVHPNAIPQGYQAVPPGYQGVPQGYQAPPVGQVPPQQVQYIPHGAPYQVPPQQGVPQQVMPQQAMPQQVMPQQAMPQQAMPQQAMPQQAMPQVVAQQAVPQQAVPQQAVPIQNQVPVQAQPVQPQAQAVPAQQPVQAQAPQQAQQVPVQAAVQQPVEAQQPIAGQPAGQPAGQAPIQPVAAHG